MKNVKDLINEEIMNFITESIMNEMYGDIYDLYEVRDELMRNTIRDFMETEVGTKRQRWRLISFPRLKKIWEDAARMGFVRDEKGLEMIKNQMIKNVIQLDVNTELMGHAQSYPNDEIKDLGYTMEEFEAKMNDVNDIYFIDPKSGQWRLSDYGLKPLWDIALKLIKEQDHIRQIMYIDQMLNVVHQRSDLASWFVEGGSAALSQLSGQYHD